MLNVKLVQKNVDKQFFNSNLVKDIEDIEYIDTVDYLYDACLDSPSRYLPFTCSGRELQRIYSEKQLANDIAFALLSETAYLQVTIPSHNKQARKIAEKFGFKEVTTYRGNDYDFVTIYYINLTDYSF